jgi:membrane protein YdbS with pleckstrin-like domain
MTSTSSSGARTATGQHGSGASDKPVKHVHHGRTPAAWTGSLIALLAFIVGGIGFVIPPHPNWVVVGIAAVLIVIALIATVVMRKLGLGAD